MALLTTAFLPCQTAMADEGNQSVTIDVSDLEEQGGEYVDESKYQYIVRTSSGNLNVRESPSTSAKIIGSLPSGTVVEASFMQPGGIPKGWSYISSPICGYVSDAYLEFCGTP